MTVEQFRALHPNAEPLHGGGTVLIGTPAYKRIKVRGTRSKRLADRGIFPETRWRTVQVSVEIHSEEFDFEKLGWQKACELAWRDAAGRSLPRLR